MQQLLPSRIHTTVRIGACGNGPKSSRSGAAPIGALAASQNWTRRFQLRQWKSPNRQLLLRTVKRGLHKRAAMTNQLLIGMRSQQSRWPWWHHLKTPTSAAEAAAAGKGTSSLRSEIHHCLHSEPPGHCGEAKEVRRMPGKRRRTPMIARLGTSSGRRGGTMRSGLGAVSTSELLALP